MAADPPLLRLAAVLGDPGPVLERWHAVFASSPLPVVARTGAAQLASLVAGIIEGLRVALPALRSDGLSVPGELTPGSASMRDAEKATGFLGASLAALGCTGFDVAGAILALRDTVRQLADADVAAELVTTFEWLEVLALESFAAARARQAEEAVRAMLEQATPVVQIVPALPAAMLIGAPDSTALDTIFSRLLLMIVRVGAPAAIIDTSGLRDPVAPVVMKALGQLAGHRKIVGRVELISVGLTRAQEAVWADLMVSAGTSFVAESHLMGAVGRALAVAGLEIRPAGRA